MAEALAAIADRDSVFCRKLRRTYLKLIFTHSPVVTVTGTCFINRPKPGVYAARGGTASRAFPKNVPKTIYEIGSNTYDRVILFPAAAESGTAVPALLVFHTVIIMLSRYWVARRRASLNNAGWGRGIGKNDTGTGTHC
jgi:hypothetical protein